MLAGPYELEIGTTWPASYVAGQLDQILQRHAEAVDFVFLTFCFWGGYHAGVAPGREPKLQIGDDLFKRRRKNWFAHITNRPGLKTVIVLRI